MFKKKCYNLVLSLYDLHTFLEFNINISKVFKKINEEWFKYNIE